MEDSSSLAQYSSLRILEHGNKNNTISDIHGGRHDMVPLALEEKGEDEDDSSSLLVPPFASPQRKSNITVATFNLVATIVGGGVLSLPLAFSKCGTLLATGLMIVGGAATDFSLYLLCLSARQTGTSSFGEVGEVAFGQWMEWFITGLVFVFLMFVVVAYMVLVRDIWTPIVVDYIFVPFAYTEPQDQEGEEVGEIGDRVLLAIVLLLSPFLAQRTLYALRYNCYVGFASISILCAALIHHAWQTRHGLGDSDATNEIIGDASAVQAAVTPPTIRYMTSSFGDALFAFPIIVLSFLSSFNVLSIQSSLIRPTKKRVLCVVHEAVGGCFLLMYCFGLSGYLYFGDKTEGNILLNLSEDAPANNEERDWMIVLGRIGCGVTIMLAMPMMVLPCRDNVLELVDAYLRIKHEEEKKGTGQESIESSLNEETGLLLKNGDDVVSIADRDHVSTHSWVHFGSTFLIVGICYVGAVAAPSVAIVWSLCGSSMGFIISFILPVGCYIQIQERRRVEGAGSDGTRTNLYAWCVLVVAVVAAVACTTQTAFEFTRP